MKLLVSWAKSLGMEFDYVPAVGVAGGLVSLWRKSALKVVQTKKNQRYLLLFVQFRNSSGIDVVGNVYGPNNVGDRVAFFNSLGADLRMATGSIILGGDFNAILNDGERSGSEEANSVGDASFKSFVEEFELTDLPLRNGDSTWGSTRGGGLWSKLDRWLLNGEAILRLDGACQSVEDWGISDHRVVTLKLGSHDFGPKPFTFFNCWLLEEGFKNLVEVWWNSALVEGWSSFMLQEKLKGLKGEIKEWRLRKGAWGSEKIKELEEKLHDTMSRMEREGVSDELRRGRLAILNHLWAEYRKEESKWLQKSRLRWLKLGDKNSHYFHNSCKVRESHNSLANLIFNGVCLSDPGAIKLAIFNHFHAFFKRDPRWGAKLECDNLPRVCAADITMQSFFHRGRDLVSDSVLRWK
ncbi:uncharacterized protein LOC130713636 [Lotus japonicus]|uniref:uncharacterized protein LOC130713636 n=1 Tax=Lotus japonicus TaxID=34305 RepID=UPI0025891FD3|nr:uncharacterized protein LOC130713636 [Lotus japonicus]